MVITLYNLSALIKVKRDLLLIRATFETGSESTKHTITATVPNKSNDAKWLKVNMTSL